MCVQHVCVCTRTWVCLRGVCVGAQLKQLIQVTELLTGFETNVIPRRQEQNNIWVCLYLDGVQGDELLVEPPSFLNS